MNFIERLMNFGRKPPISPLPLPTSEQKPEPLGMERLFELLSKVPLDNGVQPPRKVVVKVPVPSDPSKN